MPTRMTLVLNVVLFQVAWFACVLGAAWGMPWAGVVATFALVAWHLANARRPGREAALIAAAAGIGAVFETLLVQSGWVRFTAGVLVPGFAPYWMVALWAAFATTLNVSMRVLHGRVFLAVLLGAIGGPLAYYGGARLGAMELVAVTPALVAIGVGWGILTPALIVLARRLDGYAPR